MALPLVCALEPSYCARQQLCDPPERNPQHLGNLAISKPIVAQVQALALALRQHVEHAPQPMSALVIDETQLWVESIVDHEECRLKIALDKRRFPPQPGASLEGEVMSDTKEPALKI
jgi:hypothetical protein